MATVEVDDTLLEEALKATGDTAKDAVEKGLMEVVRVAKLRDGIKYLQKNKDYFWPNYLETIRPNSYAALEKRGELPPSEREEVTSGRRSR